MPNIDLTFGGMEDFFWKANNFCFITLYLFCEENSENILRKILGGEVYNWNRDQKYGFNLKLLESLAKAR